MAVAGARIMVKVGAENKYRNFGSATLLILNYKNILKYYFASGIIESLLVTVDSDWPMSLTIGDEVT